MEPRRSARWMTLSAIVAALGTAALAVGCADAPRAPAVASGDACLGVAPSDLARVEPRLGTTTRLEEEVGKQHVRTVRGVRVVLPAEPGLGAAAARRFTACRVARSGIATGELSPIVVRARELADAVEVTVASEDVDVARAIVARELPGG